MFRTALIVAILSTSLAGCDSLSNNGQRTVLYALGGALVATAIGSDPLLGAGLGAGAAILIK